MSSKSKVTLDLGDLDCFETDSDACVFILGQISNAIDLMFDVKVNNSEDI